MGWGHPGSGFVDGVIARKGREYLLSRLRVSVGSAGKARYLTGGGEYDIRRCWSWGPDDALALAWFALTPACINLRTRIASRCVIGHAMFYSLRSTAACGKVWRAHLSLICLRRGFWRATFVPMRRIGVISRWTRPTRRSSLKNLEFRLTNV